VAQGVASARVKVGDPDPVLASTTRLEIRDAENDV
jgi:hypothetical protein